ncbi:sugar ABC transporter substrate-binding protein [Streptomyces sp. XY332]|uniref:sugar ABC transporter substrate-binding protein n=1 Tax=Streptomyces sp. XY332 TaxID=1415561 RepID=UPI00099C27DB|nr:sugar ABC transporter substrate-binding protein [Streptomyces sp. XY332]
MNVNHSAPGRRPSASRRRNLPGPLPTAAVAVTLAFAAACSGPAAEGGSAKSPAAGASGAKPAAGNGSLHIAVISHGGPGDAFWNVVKNGSTDAGKQLGVQVDYNSDPDPSGQAKLIDNAVAQHVGGLVVSMANPDALQSSVKAAVAAGIPVITINSGSAKSREFGAIGHVGQEESVAGEGAGAKLRQSGRHKVLCVIHEAGNIGLNQRCDGARKGFGGDVVNLQVDAANPTDVLSRIRGALQADPAVDGVLTLNAQIAATATEAVKALNSKAQVATFDLNTDVIGAVKAGTITFAVDQQQYEQGYLPVVMLKLQHDNGNTVGGGLPVLTGPAFVDASNVDQVAKYAARGTR